MTDASIKLDIKSLTLGKLAAALDGQPRFRAGQVYGWLHRKRVLDFSEMTDLPASLREHLRDTCYINRLGIEKKLVSDRDDTVKYLYSLLDQNRIETVMMSYAHGNSLCISSQVGCRMGCSFCASTIGGLVRNLSPSEMLDQVYATEADTGRHADSIVVMGIGEPLDNFDNLIDFLTIIQSKEGKNLSLRHVSVSTCGLVDKIKALAKLKLGITLSVSLHAPNDELRQKIMPVGARWSVQQLLDACRDYFAETGRRISFEYALIRDVNDSPGCARELAARLRGSGSHVNLIPVNPVAERGYERSGRRRVDCFLDILLTSGINATVRRELGTDIEAACGQLRRKTGL